MAVEKLEVKPGVGYELGVDYDVDKYDPVKDASIQELSDTVGKYARALADRVAPTITLRYPWVLVRVLPRENIVGSIIVPGSAQGIGQNKPTHEGIVLHTWKPWTKHWTKSGAAHSHHMEPSVKMGDHVLFHHWAGHDLYGFDKQEFRVVRSEDWSETVDGGIIAVLDYDQEVDTHKVLADMIEKWSNGHSTVSVYLADEIQKRYQLIDKTKTSITLSGR